MSRNWWRAAAVAALHVPIIWYFSSYEPADRNRLVHVNRTDLTIGVEVTGELKAMTTSRIGPPQVATIYRFKIAMMADEGMEVEPGTPVLAFDPSELHRSLQVDTTEAEAARKEIEKLEVDLKIRRRSNLLEMAEAEAALRKATLKTATPSDLVSTIEESHAGLDLELAEAQVENLKHRLAATRIAGDAELAALRANLAKAEADVRTAREAITKMTRTAPRSGIVTHIRDWRGEKKTVGDVIWVRNKVVEIPDLSTMMADGEVEEALSGRLKVGQGVTLHLDAHPEVEYRGKVSAVSRAVQKRSWRNPLKIVNLEIALDTTDPERMRPGMRFRGTVETDHLDDVLTVPLAAVFPSSAGPIAFRRGTFGFSEVDLELGRRNNERVQVLDGLTDGDTLSTSRRDR